MDEVVLRRVVGVITLAIAAFLLSWLLPRPGLDRLRGEGERVVTVDLTRPDAQPQEVPPPSEEPAPPPQVAEPASAPEPESEPAQVVAEPVKPAEPASKPTTTVAASPEPAHVAEAPKPAAVPKPAEPKPAAPRPAEPKPAPKPAEAPKPSKPAAASSGGAGQVMVQAGAYSFLDKAESVRERAGAKGQSCVISPAETPKGTLYRLRCGPYADRDKAQAAAKALTAAGIAAQVVGAGR